MGVTFPHPTSSLSLRSEGDSEESFILPTADPAACYSSDLTSPSRVGSFSFDGDDTEEGAAQLETKAPAEADPSEDEAEPLLYLVIESDAPVRKLGEERPQAEQRISARVAGLQLVLMPSYLPGLIKFGQIVTGHCKKLLDLPFPPIPFDMGPQSIVVSIVGGELMLPIDQACSVW